MHRGPRELRLSQHRVTIRPAFPGHVLFFGLCPGVRAGFRKSAVCPGFWPNPQVQSNVANCKGVRRHEQIKLVSFQYKMSVTSQNATLVQASCTCLALSSVYSVSIQKHVSPVV